MDGVQGISSQNASSHHSFTPHKSFSYPPAGGSPPLLPLAGVGVTKAGPLLPRALPPAITPHGCLQGSSVEPPNVVTERPLAGPRGT